jgi:hypothetical protein
MYKNDRKLREKGILYPKFPGDPRHKRSNHIRMIGYAQNSEVTNSIKLSLGLNTAEESESYREWFGKLFVQKTKEEDKTIVISSEHCSALLTADAEIERLHSLLTSTGHEVKLIVYVREQVNYLKSSYSTQLKNGDVGEISYPSKKTLEEKYNYSLILNKWASFFKKENMIVRVFERDKLKNKNLIHDFLDIVGGKDFDVKGLVFEESKNESLGENSAEFMRLFNKLFPRIIDGELNRSRGPIASFIEGVSHGESLNYPKEFVVRLRNELAESNAQLRRDFIDGEYSNPFTIKEETILDNSTKANLTKSELMQIWASLWSQVVNENNNLRKEKLK